ncbi:aspartyl protease family protein [Marivirga sp.]|uniref:aspartyl protease family protein n=1 Tax=Marivirga sp. TaxID=2018662 RepID=UPI002D7F1BD1|nr:aspartyl protease family protein [Marivirga sp.]HET8859373.1 aspartyl protease family protein [Marivirga sp.]
MIKKYIWYAFLAFLLLAVQINYILGQNLKFGFEINENKKSITIPFELNSNLIIVDVLFQGIIPLKYIVDTGVSNTVLIEKAYADILDIEPDRKITLVGAAGIKEVEAFIVNQTYLKVGGVTGHNIPLLILKEDYLNLKKNLGIKIHGILGYDFFKNFIVKIDYKNRVLKLYQPRKFNRPLYFYKEVEMKIENNKPYVIQEIKMAEEDTVRVLSKLMIDTGASHSLMLHANSSDYINLPEDNIRDVLGAGIAGDITGHSARIADINFGPYYLNQVVTSFPDVGAYDDIIKSTGRNGTIGGGILKRFNFFFDYENEKIHLRRNSIFKEDFDYDMSGMTVIARGEYFLEPYYEVEKVRKGTPAYEAGIRAKDKIIRLNGHSGKELSIGYINNMLRKREGKKIKLKIKRDDKTYNISFILEKFI